MLVGVSLLQATTRDVKQILVVMAIFIFLSAGIIILGLAKNRVIGASVVFLLTALLIGAWVWKP